MAELPPDWEEVHDDAGRVYWWNVVTNETTWIKPVKVIAKTEIAAGADRAFLSSFLCRGY